MGTRSRELASVQGRSPRHCFDDTSPRMSASRRSSNAEAGEEIQLQTLDQRESRRGSEVTLSWDLSCRLDSNHAFRDGPDRMPRLLIPETGRREFDVSIDSEPRAYLLGSNRASSERDRRRHSFQLSETSLPTPNLEHGSHVSLQPRRNHQSEVVTPPVAQKCGSLWAKAIQKTWLTLNSRIFQATCALQNAASRVVALRDQIDLMTVDVRHPQQTVLGNQNDAANLASQYLPILDESQTHTRAISTSEDPDDGEREPVADNLSSSWRHHNTSRKRMPNIIHGSWTTCLSVIDQPATEALILILIIAQACIVVAETASESEDDGRSIAAVINWTTVGLLVIFSLFTLELCIKIVLFWSLVPDWSIICEYIATLWRTLTSWSKAHSGRKRNCRLSSTSMATRTKRDVPFLPSACSPPITHHRTEQIPINHGRHGTNFDLSFWMGNCLDFIAVFSFWLDIIFNTLDVKADPKLGVLRAMSCLRMLRFLNVTPGTSAITRSIKLMTPTLSYVGLLVMYFWLLFAIAGVVSFKSSLGRVCVWDGTRADPPQNDYTQIGDNVQHCGSWWAMNGTEMIIRRPGGTHALGFSAGFTCGLGSQCLQRNTLYNDTASFDNVGNALVLVFVIMTGRSFADIMYYLTDSDGLSAVIFFIAAVVILRLWLISLLAAVVVSSTQDLRKTHKVSSVSDMESKSCPVGANDAVGIRRTFKAFVKIVVRLKVLPTAIITINLIVQSSRYSTMGDWLNWHAWLSEVVTVSLLDCEIALRFTCKAKGTRYRPSDWVDLMLAVITTVIQIPAIYDHGKLYSWLSVFQVVRIYRVALSLKVVRTLTSALSEHIPSVLNVLLYFSIFSLLVAMFATQLFHEQLSIASYHVRRPFHTDFTGMSGALYGIYQVLTSDSWTDVLFDIFQRYPQWYSICISFAFFFSWLVVLGIVFSNMLLGILQGAFHLSDDQKRLRQVQQFLRQNDLGSVPSAFDSFFNRNNDAPSNSNKYSNASTDVLLRDSVMRDFLDDVDDSDDEQTSLSDGKSFPNSYTNLRLLRSQAGQQLSKIFGLFRLQRNPFYDSIEFTKPIGDLAPSAFAKELVEINETRKIAQRQYLLDHPHYDTSLHCFSQGAAVRVFCQRAVRPGRGRTRYQGVSPSPGLSLVFSLVSYAIIIAMVTLSSITAPLYQKEYFAQHIFRIENWFVFVEIGFASVFTLEAFVRVVADGFFFTPNAYFRSLWGLIDAVAISAMWVNVILSLKLPGPGSYTIGAFKALKVLRLLEVKEQTIRNYTSALVSRRQSLLAFTVISLSVLVAFAIWGFNLFAGQSYSCHGTALGSLNFTDCIGESTYAPFGWDILTPGRVVRPQFSFDNFGLSLLTLFRSIFEDSWNDSTHGEIAVEPSKLTLPNVGGFILTYRLFSRVLIITLLSSIILQGYLEQTGVAYLTSEQRSWAELSKHLSRIHPYRRSSIDPKTVRHHIQRWCHKATLEDSHWWRVTVMAALIVHVPLLFVELYAASQKLPLFIFVVLSILYMIDAIICLVGLTWPELKHSTWHIFRVLTAGCIAISTVLVFVLPTKHTIYQSHMLILSVVPFQLLVKSRRIKHVFGLGLATLVHIIDLLAVWLVVFLTFAIAINQSFGLTKFISGPVNMNFRTVPRALIFLFRLSMGERWGRIMEEYARTTAPYCTVGERYFDGDCGSSEWAYVLFISWNIMSMYLFASMFVSIAVESFSLTYERNPRLYRVKEVDVQQYRDAWSHIDPHASGYIPVEAFPRLLSELSGAFETRIHEGDSTLHVLMENSRPVVEQATLGPVQPTVSSGSARLDLQRLDSLLNKLPLSRIREQRRRLSRLYNEVLTSTDIERGINFSFLLLLLVHHQLKNTDEHLGLHEFLQHRARQQRAEEAANRDIILGFFSTIHHSRKFRRKYHNEHQAGDHAIETPTEKIWERFCSTTSG